MTPQIQKNIEEIKKQAAVAGLNASFIAYSEDHGISIYFNIDGVKCRFSTHSVSSTERIKNEKHYSLPFTSTMGLGGVRKEKYIQLF